jgi:hypothetical protein
MELEPNLCCLWMFMDVYGCLWMFMGFGKYISHSAQWFSALGHGKLNQFDTICEFQLLDQTGV